MSNDVLLIAECGHWCSSLFPFGKGNLRKILPRSNTGEDVRTIAGTWEGVAWSGGAAVVDFSTLLVVNMAETPQLWPENNTMCGIPDREIC